MGSRAISQVTTFSEEALIGFIDELREAGYNVGGSQYIAAQDVLFALLSQPGSSPFDSTRMESWLRPVLCHSATEQKNFSYHYKRWEKKIFIEREPVPIKVNEPEQDPLNSIEKQLKDTSVKSRWILIVAILIGALVFAWFVSTPSNPGQENTSTQQQTPVQEPEQAVGNITTTGAQLNYNALFELLLVVFGGGALAVFIWRMWWYYQAHVHLQRRKTPNTPQIHQISFRSLEEDLFSNLSIFHAGKSLRKQVSVPSNDLELKETVVQTIRNAGFFTPAYGYQLVSPEYLFLVDRATQKDQQAKYFDQLVDKLKAEDVLVKTYYFDGDPRVCYPDSEQETPITLQEVLLKYPAHRLIMFSDGVGLFSSWTGDLEPWLTLFSEWDVRVILTPESFEYWGYREESLSEHFVVLPASTSALVGLPYIIQFGQSILGQTKSPSHGPFPEMLRSRPEMWIEDDEPEEVTIDAMLLALRHYLGESGYYWLSACAIYPELDWNLTLFLGNGLELPSGQTMIDDTSFTSLVRLPWFRRNYIPDWLRVRLITDLPDELANHVRELLRGLLLNPVEEGNHGFGLDFARKHRNTIANLAEPLLKILRRKEEPEGPLRDYVFFQFMVGTSHESLILRLSKQSRSTFASTPDFESIDESPKQTSEPLFGYSIRTPYVVAVIWFFLSVLSAAGANRLLGETIPEYFGDLYISFYNVTTLLLPSEIADQLAFGTSAGSLFTVRAYMYFAELIGIMLFLSLSWALISWIHHIYRSSLASWKESALEKNLKNQRSPLGKTLLFLVREPIVYSVIILAAITLVIDGFPVIHAQYGDYLHSFYVVCVVYYVLEVVIKVFQHSWKGYWRSHWNKFDFIIVVLAFPVLIDPLFPGEFSGVETILIVRLVRIFKLYLTLEILLTRRHVFRGLDKLFDTFMRGFVVIRRVTVIVIFFVLALIVSMGANGLLGQYAPEYFGDPYISFYSVISLFSPSEVAYLLALQEGVTTGMLFIVRIYMYFAALIGFMFFCSLGWALYGLVYCIYRTTLASLRENTQNRNPANPSSLISRQILRTFVRERAVLSMIILNAIALILDRFPEINVQYGERLYPFSLACLAFYVTEVVIKVSLDGWSGYWKSNWNKIDFITIVLALLVLIDPLFPGEFRGAESILIIRLVHFFKLVPGLQVSGILRLNSYTRGNQENMSVLTERVSVIVSFVILAVIVAMGASELFGRYAPEYFGDPYITFYSVTSLFSPSEIAAQLAQYAEITPGMLFLIRIYMYFAGLIGFMLFFSFGMALFSLVLYIVNRISGTFSRLIKQHSYSIGKRAYRAAIARGVPVIFSFFIIAVIVALGAMWLFGQYTPESFGDPYTAFYSITSLFLPSEIADQLAMHVEITPGMLLFARGYMYMAEVVGFALFLSIGGAIFLKDHR